MYFNAFLCVNIAPASCTDGINKSTIFSYFSISRRHIEMISLSLTNPNARNTINKGIGARTLGIFTTIFSKVYRLDLFIIFTLKVLIGLDTFSETERISAE